MVAQVIADNKKKLAERMGSKPAETSKNLGKMREKFPCGLTPSYFNK